ncbi:MAG: hypothetical protein MRJ68_11705 [Nitrospira sp.]|nr:hypothetical protein [Nitrospira sp.]
MARPTSLVSLIILAVSLLSAINPAWPSDLENRWYIYSEAEAPSNHGYWTNYMPENGGEMIRLNLADTTSPFHGGTAIRMDIRLRSPGWCGLAVASAPNYWGQQPNAQAFNLKKARRLVFHARGQRGGEAIQVKFAIAGDQPFGDSAKIPITSEWLTLSQSWQRFEINLRGADTDRVITPFAFVTNNTHNTDPNLTFFLDEIFIETQK